MTHNTHQHSSTKKTPNELLFGYTLKWPHQMTTGHKVPSAEERIQELNNARREAHASLKIAQTSMQTQHDKHGLEEPSWKPGDLMWLEGKNLKTQYPAAKLALKHFGPFKILEKIGKFSYKLELPLKWKIHNVFHGSLITPYKETEEHRENFSRPPPVIVNKEEEFEVEQIVSVRQFGKQKTWQYLMKWKGYPNSENTWEPLRNLKNSMEIIHQWHWNNPKQPKPSELVMKLIELKPQTMQILRNTIERKHQLQRIVTRLQELLALRRKQLQK
jgi:hypothetical protein